MVRRKQVTYSSRPSHAARSAHKQGARQFKTYDTSYIQPKRRKNNNVVGIIVVVVALALLIFGVVTLFNSCTADSAGTQIAAGTEVMFVVDEGAATSAVASDLQKEGLISSAQDFTNAVTASGNDTSIKPGSYKLVGGMTQEEIIAKLCAGPVVESLSVPEGYTIEKTAAAVADAYAGSITAEQFTAACADASVYAADYPFLADAGTNSLEGYLFPKTYPISSGDTADSVVRSMLTQFQTETASVDYSHATEKGLSTYDVLIMASIVEKESSLDDQIRAQVASVFYNRMEYNDETAGFLQSDATTAYEVKHDPTPADVQTDSPYNTYTRKGLPPTPICSPSLGSLNAACNPADTNYYYFYFADTDNDGKTEYMFSETYDEHQNTFA